ncbi:hypothetical protein PF003_g40634 [Phytophthora fragariae]|nr:hypothetical protein PF003_g40634 [Phytophthora fragariae]
MVDGTTDKLVEAYTFTTLVEKAVGTTDKLVMYTFTTLVEKVVGTTDKLAVAVGSPSGDYRSLSSLAKRSYD